MTWDKWLKLCENIYHLKSIILLTVGANMYLFISLLCYSFILSPIQQRTEVSLLMTE